MLSEPNKCLAYIAKHRYIFFEQTLALYSTYNIAKHVYLLSCASKCLSRVLISWFLHLRILLKQHFTKFTHEAIPYYVVSFGDEHHINWHSFRTSGVISGNGLSVSIGFLVKDVLGPRQ